MRKSPTRTGSGTSSSLTRVKIIESDPVEQWYSICVPPVSALLEVTHEPMPRGCDDDKVRRAARDSTGTFLMVGIGRFEDKKVTSWHP